MKCQRAGIISALASDSCFAWHGTKCQPVVLCTSKYPSFAILWVCSMTTSNVCLNFFCRALVRRSRILLLDEATSSVDYDTDALIQQTIRREFGDGATTVLTIAHRLESVLDADRIVVMDAGRVGEIGSPAELLADPSSLFSQLLMAETHQRDMYADNDL